MLEDKTSGLLGSFVFFFEIGVGSIEGGQVTAELIILSNPQGNFLGGAVVPRILVAVMLDDQTIIPRVRKVGGASGC